MLRVSWGRHWPGKEVWDVRPWRPRFHAFPVVCKGPSYKSVHKTLFLVEKWTFSNYRHNFCPNCSPQSPNLEIFIFQDLATSKKQISVRTPHTSGRTLRAAHSNLATSWVSPPVSVTIKSNLPISKSSYYTKSSWRATLYQILYSTLTDSISSTHTMFLNIMPYSNAFNSWQN